MSARVIAMVAALLVMVSLARTQATETPAQLFERGNAAYEAGDYGAAVEDYEKVAGAGVIAADLFYNLGNAYFKQGDLGRAVLWFERARRLAPRDADVRDNLDLTRSLLRDQE